MSEAARLDDRAQIEEIIHTYAVLLDGGDWNGLSDLFAHGELVVQVTKRDRILLRGAAEVLAWLHANVRRYEDGTTRTSHVNTNLCIRIAEDGRTAQAHTYVTVFQKVPAVSNKAVQCIFSGRYEDVFEKIDGKWWLTRRAEVAVAVGDMSAHALGAAAPIPTSPARG